MQPIEKLKILTTQNTENEIDPNTLEIPKSAPQLKVSDDSDRQISNKEIITAIFHNVPKDAFPLICSKPGNPDTGGWIAEQLADATKQLPSHHNNYISCSSFYPNKHGKFNARKEHFAALHFLMFDDIGTKIPFDQFDDIEFSWLIESSPGNYQGGIILVNPITNYDEAARLINAVIAAGLSDSGSSGPIRWARLPVGINGKPKYDK